MFNKDFPLFINARTDIFFKFAPEQHKEHLQEALNRAEAYKAAGANGFFVPGLTNPDLISELCKKSPLPINIMTLDPDVDIQALSKLGVGRISFGPAFYLFMQKSLKNYAMRVLKK